MLMRFDPFRELDRLAQNLGSTSRPAPMPMDAYRHGDAFLVEFDLPGVEPSAIELTVEKNVMTVRAERKPSRSEEDEVLVAERPYGVFSRQLFLGDGLDLERINASYSRGVLTLTVPVAEQAKPRRVEITTGDGDGQSEPIEAGSATASASSAA